MRDRCEHRHDATDRPRSSVADGLLEIKTMCIARTLYPVVLASANLTMGWLLYRLSEPILGSSLVVTGILVVIASIGTALSRHRPVLSSIMKY
jgi:hypothetical protein